MPQQKDSIFNLVAAAINGELPQPSGVIYVEPPRRGFVSPVSPAFVVERCPENGASLDGGQFFAHVAEIRFLWEKVYGHLAYVSEVEVIFAIERLIRQLERDRSERLSLPAWDIANTCNECGRSVGAVLGKRERYNGRIPDGNDIETRTEMGKPFPLGEWMCLPCEEAFDAYGDK